MKKMVAMTARIATPPIMIRGISESGDGEVGVLEWLVSNTDLS